MANFLGLEGWDEVFFTVLRKLTDIFLRLSDYFLKGLGDMVYDFLSETYRFIVRLINTL